MYSRLPKRMPAARESDCPSRYTIKIKKMPRKSFLMRQNDLIGSNYEDVKTELKKRLKDNDYPIGEARLIREFEEAQQDRAALKKAGLFDG